MIEIDFSKNTSISEVCKKLKSEHKDNELINILENFIHQNKQEFFTSGSTGKPKKYFFNQNQIKTSALQTLKYFDLTPGKVLLSPLSLDFVAGKMNVYRAIYGRLKLIIIPPQNIFENLVNQEIDLITLVPNQFFDLYNKGFDFTKTKKILIGGGPFNIKNFDDRLINTNLYTSFASTETLTHFGLKRLYPNPQKNFQKLAGFTIQNLKEGTYVYHSEICPDGVKLNDELKLINDNEFKWIGRSNQFIKSGGLKLFPNQIEQKIYSLLSIDSVVLGIEDEKFGEIVVLCLLDEKLNNEVVQITDLSYWKSLLKGCLKPYEIPKKVFKVQKFSKTVSGKIKREELKQLIQNLKV